MGCRKEETLLLSEAAFTVSMVISVRLVSGHQQEMNPVTGATGAPETLGTPETNCEM